MAERGAVRGTGRATGRGRGTSSPSSTASPSTSATPGSTQVTSSPSPYLVILNPEYHGPSSPPAPTVPPTMPSWTRRRKPRAFRKKEKKDQIEMKSFEIPNLTQQASGIQRGKYNDGMVTEISKTTPTTLSFEKCEETIVLFLPHQQK
ncbi:hypothetical protein PIB30_021739 [Stylosanthes scabra]|uniref:Uncharacterized protein n=1 Tax=Stylosanthes scabra TaxID=79078 RepID=A0ABU6T9P5_9FABA|nr:hypothetical protein [Stylosanthes scabra]